MTMHEPLPTTALIQRLESELTALVEDLLIARPPAQLDQREAYFNYLRQHRRQFTNDILEVVKQQVFRFQFPIRLN